MCKPSCDMSGHHVVNLLGIEVEYRRLGFRNAPPHQLHAHDRAQLACVISGMTRFQYGGSSVAVGPGHLSLFPSGQSHTCHADGNATFDVLSLEFDQGKLGEWMEFSEDVPEADIEVLRSRLHDLCSALDRRNGPELDLELDLVAMQLFAACSALLRGGGLTRSASRASVREKRAVAIAREMIDAFCTEQIGLEALSAAAGLSPWRLARAFSTEMGLPPHAYQLQRRLALARCLILSGTPLAEAAVRCGFSDQSHLSRHFRRAFLVTPGRYARPGRSGRSSG